jgi:hypothetical protein
VHDSVPVARPAMYLRCQSRNEFLKTAIETDRFSFSEVDFSLFVAAKLIFPSL